MSMYGKNHYNIVISLQLIKINEEKKRKKNKNKNKPEMNLVRITYSFFKSQPFSKHVKKLLNLLLETYLNFST